MFTVSYNNTIRAFDSKERAIQWSRQCGIERLCVINPADPSAKWKPIYTGCYEPA